MAHLKRIVVPEDGPTANATNLSLINSLLGIQQPAWHATDGIEWFGEGLNDSQKEAVKFCLEADNIACIHGPPGVSIIKARLMIDGQDPYSDRIDLPAALAQSRWQDSYCDPVEFGARQFASSTARTCTITKVL